MKLSSWENEQKPQEVCKGTKRPLDPDPDQSDGTKKLADSEVSKTFRDREPGMGSAGQGPSLGLG